MSTKTTLKRIALVAVSALGFGVLTTVAPSNAAMLPTGITVGTIPTAQVGVRHTTPISVTSSAFLAAGSDTFTVNVRVTSAPAGSAWTGLSAVLNTPSSVSNNTTFAGVGFAAELVSDADAALAFNSTQRVNATITTTAVGTTTDESLNTDLVTVGVRHTTGARATAPTSIGFNIGIMPDKPGSYTVLVSVAGAADSNLVDAYAAGHTSANYTFSTGAAVSAIALSAVTGASTEDTLTGQLVKVTLTGALGVNETVTITDNSTTARLAVVESRTATTSSVGTYATSVVMTADNFINGVGYFLIRNTEAETVVITATGSGLLSPTLTSTLSTTFYAAYAPTTVTISDTATNVTAGGQANHVGVTSGASTSDRASTSATSHAYTATVTAGLTTQYLSVSVLDSAGKITGVPALTYSYALGLGTTTTATLSFSAACTTAGACFTATVDGTTDGVIVVTAEAPAQATVAVTGTTGSVMRAAHGGSTAMTVVVRDQFRNALANSSVTISVTGRNATTAGIVRNTDASGLVSYTLADAGTATTSSKQDVVTFTGPTAGSATVTINYTDSTLGVSTVDLETPTTDDTAASGTTWTDINASSSSGATGSTTARTWTTITATVKDANGAVLSGVPVTFATTSTGAAVASTFATVYTDASGEASSRVYGWTAGVKNFTATAGGKSATGTVAFRQGGATASSGAGEVRTIEATRSGNIITVTAKDRFGNLVAGVPLWGTRTGNGLFGGGNNTAGRITGVDGKAEFVFNGGSEASVVTIQAGGDGSTTAPTDACYGQTGAKAGIVVCSTATTQTAFTAFTAGTVTTAEIGVGAEFAPAGINSVTVNVPADTTQSDAVNAAADAALEAIDAANAATDAANLAAEAADAATVAAEEARDAADAATAAVEALASEVATLIAGLKAQITTLANTVAKIAKRVRA